MKKHSVRTPMYGVNRDVLLSQIRTEWTELDIIIDNDTTRREMDNYIAEIKSDLGDTYEVRDIGIAHNNEYRLTIERKQELKSAPTASLWTIPSMDLSNRPTHDDVEISKKFIEDSREKTNTALINAIKSAKDKEVKSQPSIKDELDTLIATYKEVRTPSKNKKTSKVDFFSANDGELSLAEIILHFTTNGRNERYFYYKKLESMDEIFGKFGVNLYKFYYSQVLLRKRLNHILEEFKKDNFKIIFTNSNTSIYGMTKEEIQEKLKNLYKETKEKHGKDNNTKRRTGTSD